MIRKTILKNPRVRVVKIAVIMRKRIQKTSLKMKEKIK